MTTKRCFDCKTRPVIGGVRDSLEASYCLLCLDYQGWENQHSDEGHAEGEGDIENCPVCKGEDPKVNAPEIKKSHSNGGVKKGARMSSHAACDHPATKAARAACRKARAAE